MSYQADEISAQRERKQRFEQISADLTEKKNEQERLLGELEAKRAEAEQLVASAGANLSGAQADQAARLEALRVQAEQFNQSSESGGADISEDANTVDREEVVPDNAPVIPNPDGNASGGEGTGGGSSSGSDGSGSGSGNAGGGSDSSSGWLQALPPPTVDRAIRTRPILASPRRARCATTGRWAWPFPCRCPTTALTSAARWRYRTAA